MLKGSFRTLIYTSGLLVVSNANAEWYIDLSYSQNKTSLSDERRDLPGVGPIDVDNDSSGFQITGGYEVNSYIDLEISYVDFGSFGAEVGDCPVGENSNENITDPFAVFDENRCWIVPTSVTEVGGPPAGGWTDFNLPGIVRPGVSGFASDQYSSGSVIDVRAKGIKLALAGKVPVGQRFSLYLQGGMLVPEYKVTTTAVSLVFSNCGGCVVSVDQPIATEVFNKETEKSHEPELFLGLGMSFDITDRITTKIYWENYFDFGEGEYLEQDLESLNLSLRYGF